MLTILGYIFGAVIIFIILFIVLAVIWGIRDDNKRRKAIEEELSLKSKQELVKIVERLRYELKDNDTKTKNLDEYLQQEKKAKERAVADFKRVQLKLEEAETKINKVKSRNLDREFQREKEATQKAIADLEKIQAELKNSQTEINRLSQEKSDLEINLKEADNIRKSLIEELSGSSGSLEIEFIEVEAWDSLLSYVRKIIDIAQENAQLASSLEQERNELRRRVDETETQSHITPTQSRESVDGIRELHKALRHANDEIKSLSRQNALLTKENEELAQSLGDIEQSFELLEIQIEEQNNLNNFEKAELTEKCESLQKYRAEIISENRLLNERTKKLEEDAQGSLFRIGLQNLYIGIVEDVNQKMAEFNESYKQLLVELEDRLVDAIHQAEKSAFEEQLRVDAGYNLPGGIN